MSWRGLAALLWAAAALGTALSAQAAAASLQDEAQLVAALSRSPECCVIDARSTQRRKDDELAGALVYSGSLRFKPTSIVIVVADDDARALAVAKSLARTSPHPVHAVKGGYPAWKSVLFQMRTQASKAGTPFRFVIPHDTCQQGTPLHVFEAQPPRPAASKAKQGVR